MASESENNRRLEIGHVLFIDIVGYSKLLNEEQKERLSQLTDIVLATAQVARSIDEQLVRLPTGDGMALVFHHSAEEPVRCALEIAEALQKHPEIPVRMGIHSGPVSELTDVSGRTNLAGAGINMAQRVMDCGDAGHILLSQRVADDLVQSRQWASRLHDLGECEVKHGVRLRLVNLYAEQIGNPAVPAKLRQGTRGRPVEPGAAPAKGNRLLLVGMFVVVFMLICLAIVALIFAPAVMKSFSRPPAAAVPPPVPSVPASSIPEKSIAVLPFENLSSDKQNAYFADGVQDEILTDLAKIADLKVISRTSVMAYKDPATRNLPAIAQALRVANVLEGSVQRAGNRVRVNAQLIDARTDAHLWAQTYDRDLADVFAIQSEIAKAIADQLQAKLSPNEQAGLKTRPTKNVAAYDLYLQARRYEFNPDTFLQDYRTAEQLYMQAITLDPQFALAHARLAATCARIYHFYQPTAAWEKRARAEAQKALQLQPNLGEAHHVLGLCYYWFDHDYENALSEFDIAKSLLPNDSSIPWDIAAIKRRQGKWQEALAAYLQIIRVDPQNANIVLDLFYVYCAMRDWPNAQATAQRLLELTPDSMNAKAQVGYADFWATGQTTRLKSELATIPPGKDPDGAITAFRIDVSMIDRNPAGAEQALLASPLDTFSYFNGVDTPRSFFAAEIALLRGDKAKSRTEMEHARDIFEKSVREAPDAAERHAFLGLACAFLGEKERAISEGKRAVELRPESQDALDGTVFKAVLALIYTRTGENTEAIALLQHLVGVPGAVDCANYSITASDLKHRWEWDPLRKDPRFQELCQGKQR